jgi:hypothetical protein
LVHVEQKSEVVSLANTYKQRAFVTHSCFWSTRLMKSYVLGCVSIQCDEI